VSHRRQFTRHQARRRVAHHAHGHIHFVAQQVIHTVVKHQLQRDAGVQALELDQPARHHHLPEACGYRQPHIAVQALGQTGHRLLRSQQLVADGTAMPVELETGFCWFDAAGGATHQLQANGFFQLGQVVADVGAAHAPLAGGLAQAARFDDVYQQQQGGGVQHC